MGERITWLQAHLVYQEDKKGRVISVNLNTTNDHLPYHIQFHIQQSL